MKTYDIVYACLAYFAGAMSVLLNLAPITTARGYEAAGTIGPNTVTFSAAQFFNASMWITYGLFTGSIPLMVANCLGNAVATYSILVFLSVARREEKSGRTLQCTTYSAALWTSVLFVAISWSQLAANVFLIVGGRYPSAFAMTGIVGTLSSILMLSSPLMQFGQIIREKNAETLQPLMVTFAFFNTLCWSIAGIISLDPVLIICNVLCFAAVAAQVGMLLKYGRRPTTAEAPPQAIATLPFD